ncbi:MAG: hypothetical protein ABW127_09925 [Candidatus Thiodiazotropha endolucinida]
MNEETKQASPVEIEAQRLTDERPAQRLADERPTTTYTVEIEADERPTTTYTVEIEADERPTTTYTVERPAQRLADERPTTTYTVERLIEIFGSTPGELTVIALLAWIPASWLTHVIACLLDEKWGFLIAGAIMFPIAVIHGTGIWFGVW